jgi:Uma2 family endonuclease
MALSDRPRSRYDETFGDTSQPSEWVGARMTLAEFLALPEEKPYLEWDASLVPQRDQTGDELVGVVTQKFGAGPDLIGVVTQKMAPKADHGSIEFEFAAAVNAVVRPARLGRVFIETRFVTPDRAPVPDVSFYRQDRILAESRDSFGDFTIPPDIAVEIVSPSQSVSEQLRKCLGYADLGVPVSLIVDPQDRSVFVIRPNQPTQGLRGEDRIDLDDVLPGFTLTVAELFARSAPDAPEHEGHGSGQ